MIFVTVGTNEAAFDRLLVAVGALPAGDEIVVQRGSSTVQPSNATRCYEFMPFDELIDHMHRARAVVTHAGIGSIMSALACGKRPVVVPRLVRFREAVDDHQLPVARRLDGSGLVTLVEDLSLLGAAVTAAGESVDVTVGADERLVHELRDYIAAHAPDAYSR